MQAPPNGNQTGQPGTAPGGKDTSQGGANQPPSKDQGQPGEHRRDGQPPPGGQGSSPSELAQGANGGGQPGMPTAPPEEVAKLFEPKSKEPGAEDGFQGQGGSGGRGSNATDGPGAGKSRKGNVASENEKYARLSERAAAERLRRIVQRIQNERAQRPTAPGPGPAKPFLKDKQRDW